MIDSECVPRLSQLAYDVAQKVVDYPGRLRVAFEGKGVTLIHGDAREVLPRLGQVDLLVTDPPYGVGWNSGRRRDNSFGEMPGDRDQQTAYEVLALAIPHLRPYRHAYVFGPFTFDRLPMGGSIELIWDKQHIGAGDLTVPWGPSHERILFGVYVPSKANRQRGDGKLSARLRRGTVLRYPRPNSRGVRHASEKPAGLLRELIESSSCFGETVLDPFAGSGSTLVAAALEGRKAIGIETDERSVNIAIRRLERCRVADDGESRPSRETVS